MSNYTFSILDGEYLLRNCLCYLTKSLKDHSRNPSTWDFVEPSELYRCFLSTAINYKINFANFMIICFDRSPYFHASVIEKYKKNRSISSEKIKELTEKLNTENLTDTDKILLQHQLEEAKYDDKTFSIYQEVKKSFLNDEDWRKAGISTIYKQGFEADQLAYYLACKISEAHSKNEYISAVLNSSDKDWTNFVQPGVEFCSIWSGTLKDRSYDNLRVEWEDFHKTYQEFAEKQELKKENYQDLTRYEYGILKELFIKSHNNAALFEDQNDDFRDKLIEKYMNEHLDLNKRTSKKISTQQANAELFFRIINECPDENFKSYEIMKNAYQSMNIWLGKTVDNGVCTEIGVPYIKEIESLTMDTLKKCSLYNQKYMRILEDKYNFVVNPINYRYFVKPLKVVNF